MEDEDGIIDATTMDCDEYLAEMRDLYIKAKEHGDFATALKILQLLTPLRDRAELL